MTRATDLWRTMGALASALLVTATCAGCGVSKSGIGSGSGGSAGSGGATQGHGGVVGAGGNTVVGGSTIISIGGSASGGATKSGVGGTIAGSGGFIISAGGAVGGSGATTKTNAGGMVGGMGGAFGGASGTASTGGTLVIHTGGAVAGAGGFLVGAGGKLKGGATGSGTGGAGGTGGTVTDGGSTDGPRPACSEVATQAECDARTDCHSVFEDPGNCTCAALGCCARFKSCGAGDYADCLGPAMCNAISPHCELPYVVAYKSLCYEGCVKQDDCGLLPCPQVAPKQGIACSTAYGTCYYEDCAGAGRTLAKCTAGTWQVTSAACTPYLCEAPGTEGGALTCAGGKLCVVTTDTSFRTTPACVDQTCGTGPMSTSCIQDLTGNCSPKYKLDGVVVTCAMPVP